MDRFEGLGGGNGLKLDGKLVTKELLSTTILPFLKDAVVRGMGLGFLGTFGLVEKDRSREEGFIEGKFERLGFFVKIRLAYGLVGGCVLGVNEGISWGGVSEGISWSGGEEVRVLLRGNESLIEILSEFPLTAITSIFE